MDDHGQEGDAVSGFTINTGFFDGMNASGTRALTRIGMKVAANAKANVRDNLNTTGEATGDLMNSIAYKVIKPGIDGTVRVGSALVYARIHEFGGHIEAVNGDYLKFQTADGEWHTVPSVEIPARPYLKPAVMDGRGDMGRIASEEFAK